MTTPAMPNDSPAAGLSPAPAPAPARGGAPTPSAHWHLITSVAHPADVAQDPALAALRRGNLVRLGADGRFAYWTGADLRPVPDAWAAEVAARALAPHTPARMACASCGTAFRTATHAEAAAFGVHEAACLEADAVDDALSAWPDGGAEEW